MQGAGVAGHQVMLLTVVPAFVLEMVQVWMLHFYPLPADAPGRVTEDDRQCVGPVTHVDEAPGS